MPHALLLSPDDQAVSAITAVLDEMSVTCERPLDGPSAAKKLNAQTFDLVLVDCENLPAAKLIFDVCRRSQTGTNPVPIAIVDGRAGLPTAFRLGAELILTKPVAKDQARTTIRTAVNRVRKDEPTHPIHPLEEAPAEVTHSAPLQTFTQAAAAGADSSPASPASSPAVVAAPAAKMSSAIEETAPAEIAPLPAKPLLRSSQVKAPAPALPATDMFMPVAKPAPDKPSDDPVLADLESDTPTPVFSAYAEPPKKASGLRSVLLFLLLAAFGFYAAWTYQPGFREIVQAQIDRVMGIIERATGTSPQATPTRSAPVSPAAKAPTPQAAPVTATPAAGSTPSPASTGAASPAPAPANSNSTAVAPPAISATASAPAAGAVPPTADTKTPAPVESKKSDTPVATSETELPGEKTAVILSSQGAEKRLLRHVAPTYPPAARKAGVEGTVVLKTVVNAAGTVEGVRLIEGNAALAANAISAVRQWHYRPYVRDGKAQPFQTIVLVDFQKP
jgi:protein TonB